MVFTKSDENAVQRLVLDTVTCCDDMPTVDEHSAAFAFANPNQSLPREATKTRRLTVENPTIGGIRIGTTALRVVDDLSEKFFDRMISNLLKVDQIQSRTRYWTVGNASISAKNVMDSSHDLLEKLFVMTTVSLEVLQKSERIQGLFATCASH